MFDIVEKNKPAYHVDRENYRRFDQGKTAFSLLRKYPEKFDGRKVLFTTECHVSNDLHSNQRFSRTLSRTVQAIKSELLETNIPADDHSDLILSKHGVLENTQNVKTAAALFGADQSGICLLNRDWVK